MIRRHVVVSGTVQGVFFRDSCRQLAVEHAVAGWVANRPDGTVEVVFEGAPERVGPLLDWVREGPPLASVDTVTVQEEEPQGLTGFEVR
ncbi:acylphosphatase [Streptomyces kronopolitis]